ncbi:MULTISPECIES: hypothetical protein [unclassified Streptomyces]|uniref:hypothetical protein n=1 Tax=unclassified Streptomyces TaxID=2593676 RepID=UPI0036E99F08
MHSARMLLATAAASTVFVLGAPGAYAAGNDWEDQTDSSYSKGQDKEYDKDAGQDSPRGGMRTGGGALTAVNVDGSDTAKDPKFDPETYKDKEQGKDSGSGKQDEGSWSKEDGGDSWSKEDGGDSWSKEDSDSWSGKEEKPSGGMHTGGGALASPAVTAGGLAVLAVVGTGLYSVRRRKTAGSVA